MRRTALAPEIDPFVKRTAEQAIRLASLHAIGCKGRNAKVTLNDVKWGISFSTASSQVMIEGAQQYISENEAQKKSPACSKRAYRNLEKEKGEGARRYPLPSLSKNRWQDHRARYRQPSRPRSKKLVFLTIVISEPSKQGGRKSTSYVKGGARMNSP